MSGSSGVSKLAFVLLLSAMATPALAQTPPAPPANAIALDPVMADKESVTTSWVRARRCVIGGKTDISISA
ncbi:MAG TPA: hypothetical protein VHX99_09220 [Rhizomicrobium sp.]|jgi:hypothetical protein|nr:hypothetical protein [Rhizomicrobium sp.]